MMKLTFVLGSVLCAWLGMAQAVEGPASVDWQAKNKDALVAATTDAVLSSFVAEPTAAENLLAQVKTGYQTDPMKATQIAAVSQWVMGKNGEEYRARQAPRNLWSQALINAATKATDDDVTCFMLDQLRWCGEAEQADELVKTFEKRSQNVRALVALVVAELKGQHRQCTKCSADNQNGPRGLTVEYRENPCGIDTPQPRLAWKMGQGLKRGVKSVTQKAYRILAASSLELLAQDKGDLWDSGKVESDQNVGVVYAGKPLVTSQQVFWKVKTWCNYGKESAWSVPANWTMGVMAAADWRAKWIGPASVTRPDEDFGEGQWITAPADNRGVTTLTFSFDYDGTPNGAFAEMVYAGVSQHEIDVNGKAFNRWSGFLHDWRYLRFRDMTRWLVKGKNTVVVRVFADDGKRAEPIDHIRKHAPANVRAFIAKIILPNGKVLLTNAKDWQSPQGAVTNLGKIRDTEFGKQMVLRAENTSPAFAKTFTLTKPVAKAVLHVTGVGFYEAALNGKKIGDKVLDPSPTAFDKRVLYSTYQVAPELKVGDNELKILVGHGWYDMRSIATWNFETSPWRNFPRCIAQLELTYQDGTTACIVTDRTWQQVKSPLGYDDIFEGEVLGGYDSRMPDLDKQVIQAEEVSAPCAVLQAEAQPGAKVMRTFHPKAIKDLGNGAYMVDAGENVSGWIRFAIKGQKSGNVITLRYDERVNDGLQPARPSVQDGITQFQFSNDAAAAKIGQERRNVDAHFRYTASQRACALNAEMQCDRVVIGKDNSATSVWYEPRFAYNGFRYVFIRGIDQMPQPQDIEVCVVHTAFPTIGTFACSDNTFNQLMQMGEKAYRSNFADGVPTDCPHREKNGWTGDASIASELAQYLFENTAAYEKWLRDIGDTQLADGNISCIVPSSGWGYHWGNGPAWDSALSVIPWTLWNYRADRRVLDEVYPTLVKYLEYTKNRVNGAGLVSHGLGDWVPVNYQHMPQTEFTSSCYYYQALSIAANIAELKGLKEDCANYRKQAQTLCANINRKYYKGNGVYDNGGQTAQGFALAYGIVPAAEKAKVEAQLVASVEKTQCHVDLGLLGSKHVFRALSRMGRTDLAFAMITNPTKPSPVEWIQKGGTTLWEDWGDGASRNHIMFGDFVGWAYQYLAGIQLTETADSCSAIGRTQEQAFKNITIAPIPVAALRWVRASVQGPQGEIVSAWQYQGKEFTLDVVIPPNTTATIKMPNQKPQVVGSGAYTFKAVMP